MAIIQISKIQQRSGNLVDLPLLDEAQLGWANDARRLFIGTTTPNPNENVEVLTSYSNITFSQLVGSQGNLNITSAENGEVLGYDGTNWVNKGGDAGGLINLGTVANVRLGGGAIGYVLETDGLGNLSWTPKSTITAYISNVTQANPGVVTTTENNFFTDGSRITITDVNGMTQLNGNSYYVNVLTSNTFSLYSDSGLSTPVDTSGYGTYTSNGRAISSIGGSGSATAGGSNTTIQFNDNNVIQGNAGFTFDKSTGAVSIPGNVTAVNGNLGNLATANYFAGTLTTAAQPNVTSLGTLTSVSVSGNANVGNLNTAGNVIASQVTANSNGTGNNFKVGDDAYIGDINVVNTMVVKGQQDGTQGYIVFGNTNNTNYIGRNGSNAITVTGAFSVTGNANVGNIGATGGVFTTVAGSLTTASQPNVTSLGTLTSVSVSGNANIGNIGTAGLITATGNIGGGNLVTSGVVSASGNATVLGIKTDNYYYANGVAISFAGSYSNSNVASFLAAFGSNTISTTGNVTSGNVITSKYLINSIQTGISAAGSSQGTATALANTINIVSTVSTGNGVVLPTAIAGMTVYITNTSATALTVYPASGGTINELSTNAGFTHPSKATLHYVAGSSTQWYSVGATYA